MAFRYRYLLLVPVVVVVAGAGAVAYAVHTLTDPARLKPLLTGAVEKATGRTLTIGGGIGVKLSLIPTIEFDNVTLSNPPGFSRPDFARVGHVELSLALMPLLSHRVEVAHILVAKPDVMLETNAAGESNWRMKPAEAGAAKGTPAPSPAPSPNGAQTAAKEPPFAISIKDVTVTDAQGAWVQAGAAPRVVTIPKLTLSAPDDAPARLSGSVGYQGQTLTVTAQTGPLLALAAPEQTKPWPFEVSVALGSMTVSAKGAIADPKAHKGVTLTADGTFPDFKALAPLVANPMLEKISGVTVHVEAADDGSGPSIGALDVKVKALDLGENGRLDGISVSGKGSAPIQLGAKFSRPGFDAVLAGTAGDLPWLAHGASGPLTVDLSAKGPQANVAVNGTIQAPKTQAGIALNIAADIADLSQLVPKAPPGAKNLSLKARFTGLTDPVSFQFTSPSGDLSGALAVAVKPKPSVSGQISSTRFDVDSFLGLKPAEHPAEHGGERGGKGESGGHAASGPIIPTEPLPFEKLRAADANLKFSFGRLRVHETDVTALNGALSLKDGLLRLDPVSATSPGITASVMLDGSKSPASVHLTIKAPNLQIAPILAAMGLPPVATGPAEVRGDVRGTGDSPHAIAASLAGWAGVAVPSGTINMRVIREMITHFGPIAQGGADTSDLRCLAVRADMKSGVANLAAAALGSGAITAEASGDIDLGRETLDVQVRPRVRISGPEIVLPGKVDGPWRKPEAKPELSAKALIGTGIPGLLLGTKKAEALPDPCPRALALARDTTPPPASTAQTAPSSGSSQSGNKPASPAAAVLRSLLTPRARGQ